MSETEHGTKESIETGFHKAAYSGDLRQFKALESQFPEQLEAMRDSDLLDIAATQKHANIILYLALHHRFELSPDFEKRLKSFGGELFAEGVNEYHQTLEVVANAAIGFTRDSGRSLACHDIRSHFRPQPRGLEQAIHSEFYRAALNGDLEKFLARYAKDERYHYCENRHTGLMVAALIAELASIRDEAIQMLQPEASVSVEERQR